MTETRRKEKTMEENKTTAPEEEIEEKRFEGKIVSKNDAIEFIKKLK